ncbi:MAG: FAD-dependent oxidoreductase [Rhizobiales bacterium]|nr:FAD-dependent oxidoreductase [Hyphomicrobiales bacterium]
MEEARQHSALEPIRTSCCIAGGGPAGMMLGFLLARAGVDVVVLEKHADFLRDFRGDTIHPSTLELMHELGFLEEFLQRPHQEVRRLAGQIGATRVTIADFGHVPTRCKFIALMPQWDFLDFLADQGRGYPGFHLHMRSEVSGLIEKDGRIAGVKVETPSGPREVHADLIVGADGRKSDVRALAQLAVDDLGAPIDVLWFRLSRLASDESQTFGHVEAGRMLVMLNRGDYWQCAYVIAKGSFDAIQRAGLDGFRADVVELSPFLRDRMGELASWDDIKLLTVTVDRLRVWFKPGLLCIGDAAHAMSPIAGVGINLAVQDAVAAANILAGPLKSGTAGLEHLKAVQARREFPTRFTQRLQVMIQNRLISRVLASRERLQAPWAVKLLNYIPALQRIPARLVGVGVRPEHVHTPDVCG